MVAATFAESQARSDIDLAYSTLNPNLSLNAAALRQDETDQINYARNSAQVMLQLKIPLYDGGVSYSRIRGAKQTAEQNKKLALKKAGVADATKATVLPKVKQAVQSYKNDLTTVMTEVTSGLKTATTKVKTSLVSTLTDAGIWTTTPEYISQDAQKQAIAKIKQERGFK